VSPEKRGSFEGLPAEAVIEGDPVKSFKRDLCRGLERFQHQALRFWHS